MAPKKTLEDELEREIIQLIATDRLYIPISSMGGKLERARPKIAKRINLKEHENNFIGERAYARIESEDRKKAKGIKEGIEKFKEKFPKYGKILEGYIEEKRALSERHLYFGTMPNCKLTDKDYLKVMTDLGFNEGTAKSLYPELMDISRKLSRKRDEERSILIGEEEKTKEEKK